MSHICSGDPVPRCLDIPSTDRSTPMRTEIVTLRLKYVFLVFNVSRDCPANVAHRDGENAFPRCAGSSRIAPTILQSIFSTGDRGVGGVVELGGVVGVE